MNLEFIPFKLNADLADYKDSIEYISSDNGIDIYKARDKVPLLITGITVRNANLYFNDGSLITLYLYLVQTSNNLHHVLSDIENFIQKKGYHFQYTEQKQVYGWANEGVFLALILFEETHTLCLYYSLEEFSCL